jgi:uncharacterized membrane protein
LNFYRAAHEIEKAKKLALKIISAAVEKNNAVLLVQYSLYQLVIIDRLACSRKLIVEILNRNSKEGYTFDCKFEWNLREAEVGVTIGEVVGSVLLMHSKLVDLRKRVERCVRSMDFFEWKD